MRKKTAKPRQRSAKPGGSRQWDARLREATARLDAIVGAFADLYFHLDADGTILDFRAARDDDLYLSPAEFQGRRMPEILPPEAGQVIADAVARVLAERAGVTVEYSLPIRGEQRRFEGRAVPFLDDHVLLIVRNVTERYRAEGALHEAVQALRALIEATPLAVMTLDPSGTVTLWNPGAERLFGWKAEEAIGRPNPIIPAGKWAEFSELRASVLQGKVVTGAEINRQTKAGTLVDVSLSSAPLRDAKGRVIGIIAVLADITERKRAEATLRASEERYRLLFEASPQPMWVFDLETHAFLAVNDAAVRHYGYSQSEFLAMKLEDIRPADDAAARPAGEASAADGPSPTGIYPHRTRDGRVVFDEVATHSLTFAGRRARMVLLQDVTQRLRLEDERRRAEAALRRSEERYRAFVQQSSEAIWCVEAGAPIATDLPEDVQITSFFRDAYLSECNDAMAQMYGFASSSEIVGTRLPDLMDRDDPANVTMLRAFIRSGYRLTDAETRARTRRGEQRIFLNNLVGIIEDGRLMRAWGTQRDITAQRDAEEGLRRSEESLRSFVDNAVFGIYRSTVDGKLLMANRTLARMLGYDSAEGMVGRDMQGMYAEPAERERLIRRYGQADRYEGLDAMWRRADGQPIPVRLSGRPLRDGSGTVIGFEGIVQDMRERRTLEQQLRQAQKMEAVGQLAGGMAHDFNNLLTAILSTTELIEGELAPGETRIHRDLEMIQEASLRGSELIRKLLGFARRQRLALQPIELNPIVRDFAGVLRRVVPEDIEIQLALDPRGAVVHADQGAIEQILMNLATNARDAMAGGGTLRLETSHTTLTPQACALKGWGAPGEYVVLAVSDSGVGMDAETQRHLFEPFFTTKPVNLGTGLGLAMVYGLAKQHDGFLDVESAPGRGTTVRVLLPPSTDAPARRPPAHGAERLGGTETILLAEDEDSLRRAATRLLEKHGYRVLAAANGTEALRLFREHAGQIDLVVADVVMPGLGGPQLVGELRRSGRSVKVLFTSGYTERDVQETKALAPDQPFLSKPWTVTDLLGRVREVLDQPAAT
jgi:two-component system cell cycle sensor histidine kinase/response regulator CckA